MNKRLGGFALLVTVKNNSALALTSANLVSVLIAVLVFTLTGAYAQPMLGQTFDTTGHSKARGARATVGYPSGWKAQEGRGPKIIHNFLGDYTGVLAALSLAIEAYDEDVESACNQASKEQWIEGSAAANWPVTRARILNRKGKPAALIEFTHNSKLDGFVLHTRVQTMVVCHNRYMLKVSCATSNTTPELTKSNMQKIAPLCAQFFDSLVLKL